MKLKKNQVMMHVIILYIVIQMHLKKILKLMVLFILGENIKLQMNQVSIHLKEFYQVIMEVDLMNHMIHMNMLMIKFKNIDNRECLIY